MRNPLRRAYRQLSRLIVNEGFKDFAKLCGFDIEDHNCAKDPDYQALKNAYGKIQSNDELKKFYKLKMAKDGINISNLDQALYKASYDENLSRVEKFLKDYKKYSASYEQYFNDERAKRRLEKTSPEYLLRKQKDKDDSLKEAFADNVVEQTKDYIVYEARTFEEANQMRWMWMGDVLKMSNEECKKFDPKAPADSQSYKGKMSSQQMAEYMMSNNEFIMNPSWCVCAGEQHWSICKCSETNDDGSASCHLIFSKKYPNCRFCVVRNSSRFEIRDPWQAGGFDKEQTVQYGYEVMQAVFGDAVKQIACLHGVDEKLLATKFITVLNKDDRKSAQKILEQDLNPNYKDESRVPLIKHAVRCGAVKVCRLLLDKGADVNIKDDFGWTLLHFAAEKGDTKICKLLLEYGADVNVKVMYDIAPLLSAAGKGHTEICKLLLEHGADVNAKTEGSETPLYAAAWYGYTETCKTLIEHGADVNIKDKYGYTPLHRAAERGHIEVCEFLLEYGADVNAKNNKGCTPMDLAMDCRHTNICELLRQYTTLD